MKKLSYGDQIVIDFQKSLSDLLGSAKVKRKFEKVVFIDQDSAAELRVPTEFLPIFCDKYGDDSDFYCLHHSGGLIEVVVFSDHAVVNKWKNTGDFLEWLVL